MPGDIGSTRASTRTRAATVVVLTVALFALMLLGAVPGGRGARARAASATRFEPPATTAAPPTSSGTSPPASTGVPTTSPDTTPETSVVDTTPNTDPPATNSVPNTDPAGNGQGQNNGQQQYQPDQQTPDTAPMTTTEDLLVGPSTTPAPSTTVRRQDLTTTAVTRKGGSSDPKIWMIVAALVLVAIGLGLATFLYWRRTRPELVEGSDRPDSGSSTGRGSRKRSSRFSDLVITVPKST